MNQKKKFTDQFRNPNGSYHIPTWLIVVLFIFGGWPIAVCLLIARICEDKAVENTGEPEIPYAPQNSGQVKKTGFNGMNIKKKINTQKLWLILGGVLTFFSALQLPDSIQYLIWRIQDGGSLRYPVEDVVQDCLWLICGLIMLLVSAGMRSAEKKRRRVAAIVGDSDYISIDEVAEALPVSRGKAEKILQSCIDFGMFGEKAYLDMRSDCLVVRGEAPISKKARAEAEAAQAAAKAAADNLDEYERILKELRDLNDLISGEEMSAKISRLEELTDKIFKIAKEEPKKLGSMRKFMDYYLPTSLNLLHRYEKLDAQGVEGTNISESKRKIEDTMDMMVTAFEKQLDKMFLSESIDISADIAAMQNLMRADGLVENEFLEEIQSVGKRN